jgi:hypothetical protein
MGFLHKVPGEQLIRSGPCLANNNDLSGLYYRLVDDGWFMFYVPQIEKRFSHNILFRDLIRDFGVIFDFYISIW